ncbi:hypothetical protein J2X57_002131 [Luteibacter sp. 1214]|uniref:hypothetical protein n=1 Tax=Luteibacter sp. 1214 TaxID=2817735 RepID=UPI00285F4D45|nr:hypothetical protein [Luteibacter sp. 1214]MDR6642919.1 hypothetical protein [Luteibacter sp. 1214]
MLRITTANGETASIELANESSEDGALIGVARAPDSEIQVRLVRRYTRQAQSRYHIYLLRSSEQGEADYTEVVSAAPSKERLGAIFPVSAMCSTEHARATDDFFEVAASVAFDALLSDERGQSVAARHSLDETYEISDFYVESASVIVLRECMESVDLVPYLPTLLANGFAPYNSNRDVGAYLKAFEGPPPQKVKIGLVNSRHLSNGYLSYLYSEVLPFENSAVAQFVLLYQVFEMMMQTVFEEALGSFKAKVQAFVGTPSDLRALSTVLNDVASERVRIRKCIEAAGLPIGLFGNLINHCGVLLAACGKTFDASSPVGSVLYDARNLIFHGYRDIPKEEHRNIDLINGALIQLLPALLQK